MYQQTTEAAPEVAKAFAAQLRSIQILRAVAAISVLTLHATSKNGGAGFAIGAAGVDLFFIISGFIMASASSEVTASEFLRRRVWRIYPLWWVAVIVRLAFVGHSDATPARLLTSFTLWPIWGEYAIPLPPLGWTLSFEILFYVGLALALRTRPTVPLAIFSFCLVGSAVSTGTVFDFVGSPMIFEFLLGFMIAKVPRLDRWGLPLICVSLILLLNAPVYAENARLLAMNAEFAPLRVMFWGLPCAGLLYGAISIEERLDHRGWIPAVFLGNASYSIYLFHLVPIAMLNLPWWIAVPTSIAFSVTVYAVVEKPLVRLARLSRWSSHPRTRIIATA